MLCINICGRSIVWQEGNQDKVVGVGQAIIRTEHMAEMSALTDLILHTYDNILGSLQGREIASSKARETYVCCGLDSV